MSRPSLSSASHQAVESPSGVKKMSENNTVYVACACDRNFFRFVPTMVNGMLKHTNRKLVVGVFYMDVEKHFCDKLESLFPQVEFKFWEIEEGIFDNLYFKRALSPMCYARALMADLSGWDDFVYLDLDIAVTADIGELFDLDIGDNYLGSVFHFNEINSGVLKINGRRWREDGIKEKVLKYAAEHLPKDADQTSIGEVCRGQIAELPPKWNVLVDSVWARQTLEESHYRDAAITHYITGFKPWNLGYTLLPRGLRQRWDSQVVKAGFPVPWKKEATLFAYQLAMISKTFVIKPLSERVQGMRSGS
jgi:lipopolysaccharide biosynthesis glycosyltransferase